MFQKACFACAAALLALWIYLAGAIPGLAQSPTPTPTVDPLVEPFLPENPTELELGQHRYWMWCMTCHGDRGQGLTDEWRAVWEQDHQNCWARGCHAGARGDEGFPIPTIVPLIIGADHLADFAAVQDLAAFLQQTHPPQHPGILSEAEYHAIAVYVFTQNGRPVGTPVPALPSPWPSATPSALPTPAPLPARPEAAGAQLQPIFSLVVLGLALAALLFLARRLRR